MMKQNINLNKKIMIAFFLVITIIVSGCAIPGVGTQKGPESIHIGKQAFSVNFLPNAPPPRIFSDDYFQIGLRMINLGAANITDGVMVVAVDDSLMSIQGWDSYNNYLFSPGGGAGQIVNFRFPGKNIMYPEGIEELLYMNLQAKSIDPRIEDISSVIIITSCYDYQTEMIESVCIEAGKFRRDAPSACTASTITTSGGQGAPITITKVEVDTLTSGQEYVRPQFTIYLENEGKGRTMAKDKVREACSSSAVSKIESSIVKVEEVQFSDFRFTTNDIKCNPLTDNFEIRLKHDPLTTDKATVRCTLEPGRLKSDKGSYQTPLYIRLSYGYTESVSKSVIIEKQ